MDELNINEMRELEKYKITIDFLKFEATTLWQIFNAFFIGSSIFISLLGILLKADSTNYCLLLIVGIIGLLISILWFATFRRNGDWYNYRMNQAKRAEEDYVKSINDDEWYLLNRKAKTFADGRQIKGFKNNFSGYGMIVIFMSIYISLITWALFNIACKC